MNKAIFTNGIVSQGFYPASHLMHPRSTTHHYFKTRPCLLGNVATIACAAVFMVTCNSVEAAMKTAGEQPAIISQQQSPSQALTLQQYLDKVSAISSLHDTKTYDTVRSALEGQAKTYDKQVQQAAALLPPEEIGQRNHRKLVMALAENAWAYRSAALQTPKDAANNEENNYRYGYHTADVGYGRGDQADALCIIRNIAKKYGSSFTTLGDCDAAGETTPGAAVGTAQNPINDITIVHDVVPGFVDDNGNYLPRPNVNGFEISSITASSRKPITITFDNLNPPPFQFNIAVYRGNSPRVQGWELVDGTLVATGQKVHVLKLKLRPGVYTYVDNVHPTPMRGKLTVVK